MAQAVQVDTKILQELFVQLDPKQLRSASRSAFGKAGRRISNAVKAEYRGMFPGSILYRGVHMKAFRSGKGVIVDLYYTSHAKGDPLYKSFVLRFLNGGTEQRTTARGYNRGSVSAHHFFTNGVNSTIGNANEEYQDLLKKAMENQINKAKR